MVKKWFNTSLFELTNDPYIRFDVDYINISKTFKKIGSMKPLKDYITFIETGKSIKREDYSDDDVSDYAHIVVRNIKDGKLRLTDLVYMNEEKGEALSGFRIEKGDILIAISSNVGASCIIDKEFDDIQLTLSHYIVRIRVDEKKLNPKLLVHYLNSDLMKNYFRSVETGKTQKNLSKTYINILPVFLPLDIKAQDDLVEKIIPLEAEINQLKNQIKNPLDIINEIIFSEINFDIDKFNGLKERQHYASSLCEFSNNQDIRFSYKFHNEAGKFLTNYLNNITKRKIEDFISEPIVLGKGISPSQYDEEGDYFYIAMSNIKSWGFKAEDCKSVGELFYNENLNKTVQLNDILLARSGEGTIGKVALIDDDDINGVFADFTMRIRLKDYNPLFAYYYFRSDLFQFLVYTHKKGLGNNTNIFPSQVGKLPILDFKLDKQNDIVECIQTLLDSQTIIESKIERKRNEISKIIENGIRK